MFAKVRYLGRAFAVFPGELGGLYEEYCTVVTQERQTEWVEDVDTGRSYPHAKFVKNHTPLFWYTEQKGVRVFCTMSGFGPGIIKDLKKRGYRVKVEDFVNDGLGEPDLSQVKKVVWRSGQKQVFARLLAYKRGIVVCPTGWGKTFLIRMLARVYPKAEILITVDTNDVAERVHDDLRNSLGVKIVGRIGGGRNEPGRVTICTAASLHKAPKDVNIVLADECHSLMTENYVKKFNKFHRARIFGLTATPEGKSNKGEGFGLAIFGPKIADISYQQGVAGGNVVPISVRMIRSTVGPNVAGMHNKTDADRHALWLNEDRNRLVANTVCQLDEEIGPDQQMLVMVDKTEHAYALGQLLPGFPVITGEPTAQRVKAMRKRGAMLPDQEICTKRMREEYRKSFEANKLKRAIATKIWSKGVDFLDLAVLVRADGTGSPIHSGQIPGRLSRLGDQTTKFQGLLVDFLDTFSSNLQRRSQSRLKVYRQNGFQVEVVA